MAILSKVSGHTANLFMGKRLIVLISVISLIFSNSFILAEEVRSANKDLSFNEGRFSKVDGQKILFSRIIIGSGEIKFYPANSNSEETLAIKQVIDVEKQNGSEALLWGISLTGAGMFGSIIGVSLPNANGVETPANVKAGIVGGLTILSGLIGLAIGSGIKKYEVVYSNPEYKPGTSFNIIPGDMISSPVIFSFCYRF